MWWIVALVLLAGTIVGVWFLVRHLLAAGRRLMRQLEATQGVVDSLNARIEELDRLRAEQAQEFIPAVGASRTEREQWRGTRKANLGARQARRRTRVTHTLQRWREIGMPL